MSSLGPRPCAVSWWQGAAMAVTWGSATTGLGCFQEGESLLKQRLETSHLHTRVGITTLLSSHKGVKC